MCDSLVLASDCAASPVRDAGNPGCRRADMSILAWGRTTMLYGEDGFYRKDGRIVNASGRK